MDNAVDDYGADDADDDNNRLGNQWNGIVNVW